MDPNTNVLDIPFKRNPHFTGREALLASLHARLTDPAAPVRYHALTGLGGMGKSQVAIEYAYRHQPDWKIIWWLPAEDPTSLGLAYARLGQRLGLKHTADASLDEIRHYVRRKLGESDDWLLIFDNAPNSDAVRNYLPIVPSGRALITSQNAEWNGLATTTCVRELEREESVEFLLRRARRGDREQADRLAKALGDLPLALEQAAAVIEHTGASYASYLKRFETHWAELLQRGRLGAEHPDSLAMTLELSFRQVATEAPQAVELLHLCAFLSPENIGRDLLADGVRYLETAGGRLPDERVDEMVVALSRYSLVDASNGSVSLHRLTHALARQRLTHDEQARWAGAAVELTAGAMRFDGQEPATWWACAELLPHALSAALHAERLGVAPQHVADVYSATGRYLLKQSRLLEARPILERALALAKRLFGDGHPRVSDAVNNLARVLQRLGDYAAAADHFDQALSIDRQAYGAADPRVAAVSNNFATCLLATGDFANAAVHFEHALAVYEEQYGPDHPKVASVLNNLGCALRDSGQLDEARDRFRRAHAIAEEFCGPAHPTTASVLYNVAVLLRGNGELAQAEDAARRALLIDEQAFGTGHPDVARDLLELSQIAAALGLADEAQAHASRARLMLADFSAASVQRADLLREQLRAAG